MKPFVRHSLLILTAAYLAACSHGDGGSANAEASAPATAPRHTEHFTGEVVRRNGEYRFKVLSEPKPEVSASAEREQVLRLSRSTDSREFASDEIHLRKYYGKTIVVKGQLVQDWIAKAEVVGQWLRPGETRGSTLVGPEPR